MVQKVSHWYVFMLTLHPNGAPMVAKWHQNAPCLAPKSPLEAASVKNSEISNPCIIYSTLATLAGLKNLTFSPWEHQKYIRDTRLYFCAPQVALLSSFWRKNAGSGPQWAPQCDQRCLKYFKKSTWKRHLAAQGAHQGAGGTHPTPKVPQNTWKYKESHQTNPCMSVKDLQRKCSQNNSSV